MKKGLKVFIYKTKMIEATNGGFSSEFNEVLLVGENIPQLFKANGLPIVEIVEYDFRGEISLRAKELNKRCGMFGGNFIYCSDSRFPSNEPIKIFDRFE